MIRKAVIVALIVAAAGTVLGWFASFRWSVSWYCRNVEVRLVGGFLRVYDFRADYRTDPIADGWYIESDAERAFHTNSPLTLAGWLPSWWESRTGLVGLDVPCWMLFAALGAYPTVACVRGPLRHYRRRRRGLCATCGYNLTGNVSGVCPECATEIAQP